MVQSNACTSNVTQYMQYIMKLLSLICKIPLKRKGSKGVSGGAILSSVNLSYRSCHPPPLLLLCTQPSLNTRGWCYSEVVYKSVLRGKWNTFMCFRQSKIMFTPPFLKGFQMLGRGAFIWRHKHLRGSESATQVPQLTSKKVGGGTRLGTPATHTHFHVWP